MHKTKSPGGKAQKMRNRRKLGTITEPVAVNAQVSEIVLDLSTGQATSSHNKPTNYAAKTN